MKGHQDKPRSLELTRKSSGFQNIPGNSRFLGQDGKRQPRKGVRETRRGGTVDNWCTNISQAQ